LTERAHKSPKILCSGIAVQDIVMRVESFPVPLAAAAPQMRP
jgi:hypothetical protein